MIRPLLTYLPVVAQEQLWRRLMDLGWTSEQITAGTGIDPAAWRRDDHGKLRIA